MYSSNGDKMRDDFLEMAIAWKNVEVATTPNFITHVALYTALLKRIPNRENAGRLAGCIEVDVTQAFVDDKELFDTVVDGFAELLGKTYTAFMAINPTMFWTRMQKQGLCLKYN
jgi:hypothetical protein